MITVLRDIFLCIIIFTNGLQSFGQAQLQYQYEQHVRQDSSFYTSVAFAQTKHSRLVDMGANGLALWGCNQSLSHLQIQYLTSNSRLERLELPALLQEYYQSNGLTFGNVTILNDVAILVLNERFILTLVRERTGSYHIEQVYDASSILQSPIKKLHVHEGNYYVVVPEPRESENEDCDLFALNLFRLDTSKNEAILIWQHDFLKRFTRNIYFENYFFRNSQFFYFHPLTYECESVNLDRPQNSITCDYADRGNFRPSNEHGLFLQEQGNNESNIRQFLSITQEDLLKDYIKLIYPCKEGYLIWRTNYPQKKDYTLDWISADMENLYCNIERPFRYTAKDTSAIGSFDNFPVTPSGNYIQLLGGMIIVGVHHSGIHYTPSSKHNEIWKEYYKTVGRNFHGQFVMDYYIFNYTLSRKKQ